MHHHTGPWSARTALRTDPCFCSWRLRGTRLGPTAPQPDPLKAKAYHRTLACDGLDMWRDSEKKPRFY